MCLVRRSIWLRYVSANGEIEANIIHTLKTLQTLLEDVKAFVIDRRISMKQDEARQEVTETVRGPAETATNLQLTK